MELFDSKSGNVIVMKDSGCTHSSDFALSGHFYGPLIVGSRGPRDKEVYLLCHVTGIGDQGLRFWLFGFVKSLFFFDSVQKAYISSILLCRVIKKITIN